MDVSMWVWKMNRLIMTFLAVLTVGTLLGGTAALASHTVTLVDDEGIIVGPRVVGTGIYVEEADLEIVTEKAYNDIIDLEEGHKLVVSIEWSVAAPQAGVNGFHIEAYKDNVLTFVSPILQGPVIPTGSGSWGKQFTEVGDYKFIIKGDTGATNYHITITKVSI